MLKILGWLLIAGIVLCLTIIFGGFGIPMTIVGTLTSAIGGRNRSGKRLCRCRPTIFRRRLLVIRRPTATGASLRRDGRLKALPGN